MKHILLLTSGRANLASLPLKGLREMGFIFTRLDLRFEPGKGIYAKRFIADKEDAFTLRYKGWLHNWASRQFNTIAKHARRGLTLSMDGKPPLQGIHAIGLAPAGEVGRRLSKLMGIPLFLSLREDDLEGAEDSLRSGAITGADRVIVTSASWLNLVGGTSRTIVIPPAIPSSAYRFRPGPKGTGTYLVIAGEWDPENPVIHRPRLLISAVAEAEKAMGRQLTLGIVGGGERVGEFKRMSEKLGLHAEFYGELDDEGTARELQRADLYLHGVDKAMFPTSMVKALKCGTPVVASNVEGIKSFFQEGPHGITVTNRLSKWSKAIVQALDAEYDRQAIAEAHAHRYNEDETTQRFADVYMRGQQQN